jgi:uncharacterized protein (DUF2062 family)
MAIMGASIGGAVFGSIIVVLILGLVAYKASRRRARQAEQRIMRAGNLAREQSNTFHSPKVPSP